MGHNDTPLIVPVFIPHMGCPHRCVFCNQESITGIGSGASVIPNMGRQIGTFLTEYRNPRRVRSVQLAFYGGNFLGLSIDNIRAVLAAASVYVDAGRIDGIRFSTRPDTIDSARLHLLREFKVQTVELGVQSMDDGVLSRCRRGHCSEDSREAVARLKAEGYEIGLQLMVGLPGDDETRSLKTARQVAALSPNFVRIYPAVVLKGSPLAVDFLRGEFTPWSLGRSVSIVKQMFLLFEEKKIRVVRMGLQATTDLDSGAVILAGPYHPAFGHLVYSEIYFDRAVSALKSIGFVSGKQIGDRAVGIRVSTRHISRMQGLNGRNIFLLKSMFGLADIKVIPDPILPEGSVEVTDLI